MVFWNYDTFDNILGIEKDFTKCVQEIMLLFC